MMNTIQHKILDFIGKSVNKNDLGLDVDFFENGMASSLLAMQIIMFIENEFNIKVENSEMKLDNFNTINNISKFIELKVK